MNKGKNVKLIFTIIFIAIFGSLIAFLAIDLIDPIRQAFRENSVDPLFQKFASYGWWAPLFICLFQALQLLLVILPSQLTHIVAGFMLGPWWGFLACIAGIFIGNIMIYLLVRKLGPQVYNLFRKKTLAKIENLHLPFESRGFMGTIALMYVLPGIPYGLIAITAANSKLKFYKYIILTTIASIPSLIVGILFGSVSYKIDIPLLIVLALILIILAVISTVYYQKIIAYFTELSSHRSMAYFQAHVRKPRPLLYWFFIQVLRIMFLTRYRVKVYNSEIKKRSRPFVMLFNHTSKFDFIWTFVPLYPQKVNAVTAYYYFCNYNLGSLLHNLGCFPKMLFQPDLSSIKNIKRVVQNQGMLGMAPEGRLSAYGCLESITPATGKLLKNLGVDVILAKASGSYMTFPKWSSYPRRGRIEMRYEQIFSADELSALSFEEIDAKLYDKMYYDEFEWQKQNQVYFRGKHFAEGLEHILYLCPVCGQEFTYEAQGHHLHCTNCHTDVLLNNYYDFECADPRVPKTIRDWYLLQKETEQKRIEDPSYCLESHVRVKMPDPNGRGFALVGEGTTTLTVLGVSFVGTINGKPEDILFKLSNLPAIPFGVKEDFEIYHHNTLYYFIPDNIRSCVKWSVVGEQMYQKYVKELKNENE